MGKRSCAPYDPALRQTEHGSRLYSLWKKIRQHPHCEEWDDFPTFFAWSMRSGYSLGAWLRLIDESKMYAPGNVVWHIPGGENEPPSQDQLEKWNRTVNRIRKHYGMPPLRGTDYAD